MYVYHRTVVDADATYELLMSPGRDQATMVRVTPGEVIFGGFALWLSLRETGLCGLSAHGNMADRGVIPCLMEYPGDGQSCLKMELLGDDSLSLFPHSASQTASPQKHDDPGTMELNVRSYGPSPAVGQRLVDQVLAWDAAGRPSSDGLHIRAYPHDALLDPRNPYVGRDREVAIELAKTNGVENGAGQSCPATRCHSPAARTRPFFVDLASL